jgi:hypothetical protein
MKFLVGLLMALDSCLAAGCPSGPPPHPVLPPPDAADSASAPAAPEASTPQAATCEGMCANLRAIGCPEGAFLDCADICRKALADPGVPHPNVACVAAAQGQGAARACGIGCKQ